MSKLIKSSYYVSLDDIKKIEASLKPEVSPLESDNLEGEASSVVSTESSREAIQQIAKIKQEAEAAAERILSEARQQASALIEDAKLQIEQQWQELRDNDVQLREEVRQSAYEAGLEQGISEGERKALEQYEMTLSEGRTVLEQAYEAARQTIAEAEPFVIDLSIAVAQKIIGRQLEMKPEWIVDMIKPVLKRSIDKGSITLCVAPSQFAYAQSVRDELSMALDAQAELHILPDASVGQHGCVVKTSFGSIDARIETQLTEIKQALIDICRRSEEPADE